MSCSMCEAHMNEVIRNNFKVNKVSSSASAGETVIISDAELDIPWVKKQVKDIGYKVLSYESKPYEKKEKKGKMFCVGTQFFVFNFLCHSGSPFPRQF